MKKMREYDAPRVRTSWQMEELVWESLVDEVEEVGLERLFGMEK